MRVSINPSNLLNLHPKMTAKDVLKLWVVLNSVPPLRARSSIG